MLKLLVAFSLALRSRSKVGVKVKGRGQGHSSRSNIWHVAVHIKGLACRVQQKSITLKFGVECGHNRSKGFVCVSLIRGCMRIISRMRSIGF